MTIQVDDNAELAAADVAPAFLRLAQDELASWPPLSRGLLKHGLLVGALLAAWAASPGIHQRAPLGWVLDYGALVSSSTRSRGSHDLIYVWICSDEPEAFRFGDRVSLHSSPRNSRPLHERRRRSATNRQHLADDDDLARFRQARPLERRASAPTRRSRRPGDADRGRRSGWTLDGEASAGTPGVRPSPVGFLDKTPLQLNGASTQLPVLGASWDLEESCARTGSGK